MEKNIERVVLLEIIMEGIVGSIFKQREKKWSGNDSKRRWEKETIVLRETES